MKDEQEKYISNYKKETNLFLYWLYCVIDFLIFVFKFILSGFLPIIISFIGILFFVLLKIDLSYSDGLSWGLFGAALAMFGIGFSIVIAIYGSNKKYFKQNILKLFGNYKLLGVVDVFTLIIMTITSIIFSLIFTIQKDKFCNFLSFTSIEYIVVTIILVVALVSKNDENKYIHYLKNTGVLKRKKRSIKMNQNIAFGLEHPKIAKFGQKIMFFQVNQALVHESKIVSYFENPYDYKDTNLYTNIELVSFYLKHCPDYINTDFDLIRIKLLINSINKTVVDFLIKEKQFDILENFFESLGLFGAKVLVNKSIMSSWIFDVDNIEKFNLSSKEKLRIMLSINCKLKLAVDLIVSVLACFEKIEQLEPTNDIRATEILDKYKDVLQKLKEYKKKFA